MPASAGMTRDESDPLPRALSHFLMKRLLGLTYQAPKPVRRLVAFAGAFCSASSCGLVATSPWLWTGPSWSHQVHDLLESVGMRGIVWKRRVVIQTPGKPHNNEHRKGHQGLRRNDQSIVEKFQHRQCASIRLRILALIFEPDCETEAGLYSSRQAR